VGDRLDEWAATKGDDQTARRRRIEPIGSHFKGPHLGAFRRSCQAAALSESYSDWLTEQARASSTSHRADHPPPSDQPADLRPLELHLRRHSSAHSSVLPSTLCHTAVSVTQQQHHSHRVSHLNQPHCTLADRHAGRPAPPSPPTPLPPVASLTQRPATKEVRSSTTKAVAKSGAMRAQRGRREAAEERRGSCSQPLAASDPPLQPAPLPIRARTDCSC
jgi:hypothetical protein